MSVLKTPQNVKKASTYQQNLLIPEIGRGLSVLTNAVAHVHWETRLRGARPGLLAMEGRHFFFATLFSFNESAHSIKSRSDLLLKQTDGTRGFNARWLKFATLATLTLESLHLGAHRAQTVAADPVPGG